MVGADGKIYSIWRQMLEDPEINENNKQINNFEDPEESENED